MAELLINYSGSPDPVSGAAQQRDYHTSEHCTLGRSQPAATRSLL